MCNSKTQTTVYGETKEMTSQRKEKNVEINKEGQRQICVKTLVLKQNRCHAYTTHPLQKSFFPFCHLKQLI